MFSTKSIAECRGFWNRSPVQGTSYLELQLICPLNGSAVLNKLLGIRVDMSPKRECGSKQITRNYG